MIDMPNTFYLGCIVVLAGFAVWSTLGAIVAHRTIRSMIRSHTKHRVESMDLIAEIFQAETHEQRIACGLKALEHQRMPSVEGES